MSEVNQAILQEINRRLKELEDFADVVDKFSEHIVARLENAEKLIAALQKETGLDAKEKAKQEEPGRREE